MSDYMFMLESHLSPAQASAVTAVGVSAEELGFTAFLTGGAMRDMMGGFPIRDLDFTVEGHALKLVKVLEKKHGVTVEQTDDHVKSAEIRFPAGVRAAVGGAHEAKYGKPGSRPKITPSTIHEDLKRRDFTINSIALSINKASRGLLLDPANGLGDLERREIRANSNYTLYDEPSRMLRMFRLRARLNFELAEKTRAQYANVREAGLEKLITPDALRAELLAMADEPNPGELLEVLDREKLLALFSPALTGAKINSSGFAKLLRTRQAVPYEADLHVDNLGLFLHTLTGKMSDKEVTAMHRALGLSKATREAAADLAGRAKKLERALAAPKLSRASLVYRLLIEHSGDEILFLAMHTEKRVVHDRLRNHLQKYLVQASEVTDKDLAPLGFEPGTPKFAKAKLDRICAVLEGRIRKPAPEPVAPPPPAPAGPGRR